MRAVGVATGIERRARQIVHANARACSARATRRRRHPPSARPGVVNRAVARVREVRPAHESTVERERQARGLTRTPSEPFAIARGVSSGSTSRYVTPDASSVYSSMRFWLTVALTLRRQRRRRAGTQRPPRHRGGSCAPTFFRSGKPEIAQRTDRRDLVVEVHRVQVRLNSDARRSRDDAGFEVANRFRPNAIQRRRRTPTFVVSRLSKPANMSFRVGSRPLRPYDAYSAHRADSPATSRRASDSRSSRSMRSRCDRRRSRPARSRNVRVTHLQVAEQRQPPMSYVAFVNRAHVVLVARVVVEPGVEVRSNGGVVRSLDSCSRALRRGVAARPTRAWARGDRAACVRRELEVLRGRDRCATS